MEHFPAEPSLNLFAWDLRYETPTKIPAAIYSNGTPIGPLVLPGKYQVRLTVDGKSSTAPLEVKLDPRVKASEEDLRKQFELMLKLRDRQEEMNKAILAIRDLRTQLQGLERRVAWGGDAQPVASASHDFRKKSSAIDGELSQVNAKAAEHEAHDSNRLNSQRCYLGH